MKGFVMSKKDEFMKDLQDLLDKHNAYITLNFIGEYSVERAVIELSIDGEFTMELPEEMGPTLGVD
jgi:hypothetical protein